VGAIRFLEPAADAWRSSAYGRLLAPEEDLPGRPATALLTEGMWAAVRARSADDWEVITINGQPYEVAGFCRRVFLCARGAATLYGTEQADIFLPLPLALPRAGSKRVKITTS